MHIVSLSWQCTECTCNLSADELQPPLSSKVTKTKSSTRDMNWFRCSKDKGSREGKDGASCLSSTFYISDKRLAGHAPVCASRGRLTKCFHSGREIKLNIAVINVWKAEGERCCSWSLGSKKWTRFKVSLTACFASLPRMHEYTLCKITRCPCGCLNGRSKRRHACKNIHACLFKTFNSD